MQLTGAEIIIECLKEQRIDTIFGYPGGTVLSVYDALFKCSSSIRHVLTAHEQGAAHAADGYARATGKTGVCLVTSGPGATNLVTGIATAYMDSSPIVAITINVPVDNLGKDSFQEIDIAGITMPVTKHNFIVKDIESLADVIRRAFRIAGSGRKGPVLVDIARDVTESICEYEPRVDGEPDECICHGSDREEGIKAELKSGIAGTIKLLAKAKRPVILAGGGVVRACADAELRRLADMLSIPVVDTMMGKGAIGASTCYLGMAGEYGTGRAAYAIDNADVCLAIGCRFSDRILKEDGSFAPGAKLIHVDIDKAELGKNVRAHLTVNSDAGTFLDGLCEALESRKGKLSFAAWLEKIKSEVPLGTADEPKDADRLTGEKIVSLAGSVFGDDAIYVTEVGQNQIYAVNGISFTRSGQLLTSGGLGTMGFGLGAAIGAAVGCPDRRIVNFAGDGCFRMNMNELMTAVSGRLNITEIVFDNGRLGMVHEMQEKKYGGRIMATELDDTFDYAAIARAIGATGYSCRTVAELKEALAKSSHESGVNVVVCHIE